MTRARQGTGGPDGRPRCWNGEAPLVYVARDGLTPDGRQATRTIPWAFSQSCKSWVADPSTDPVPLAEGWRCDGCRHLPADAVAVALRAREARRG